MKNIPATDSTKKMYALFLIMCLRASIVVYGIASSKIDLFVEVKDSSTSKIGF